VVIRDQIAEGQPETPAEARISLRRALGEILAVYVPSFGLGIISALILLHDPSLGNDQVTGPVSALEEIAQYVMQASVTIFGVAFFCLQRGVRLPQLFGKLVEPPQYPASAYGLPYPQPQNLVAPPPMPAAPPMPSAPPMTVTPPEAATSPVPEAPANWGNAAQPADGTPYATDGRFWPGYAYYMPPTPPTQRGKGWQFARAYFISMGGVVGFLLFVVIFTAVTHYQTGAPSEGTSAYLVPVGAIVALAAGFGEEMLVTGLTVNALEAAGIVGKRSWLIYVVAVCLRIPFHLYYGWASFGVIIFTLVNIWVYRRWRLLWPVVLAHATYDFIEYLASVAPSALGGLLILGLGMGTLVMVIVVLCIELSDRGARRRYEQYTTATNAAYAAQATYAAAQAVSAGAGGPLQPQLNPPGTVLPDAVNALSPPGAGRPGGVNAMSPPGAAQPDAVNALGQPADSGPAPDSAG
jgi:membrane protease YdiL (CAAX protease family)